MVKVVNNDKVLEVLKTRENALQDLMTLQSFDDEQVDVLENFKKRYNNLKQWEKDLYYVFSQLGYTETSKLYGLAQTTTRRKIKNIIEKLK